VAREVGVTTILNTAPVPETGIPEQLFEFTDILCANETEAQMLAEKSGEKIVIETIADATRAARKVASHYHLKDVIITLGEKGSLWFNSKSDTATHGEAGKVEKVVDTTGAGDSFIGSLSVFLLKLGALESEESRKEALKRANAVAAISVQAKGTQSSYPQKEHPGIPTEWIE